MADRWSDKLRPIKDSKAILVSAFAELTGQSSRDLAHLKCPFCNDNSFSIHAGEKGAGWRCHKCGEFGDITDLHMKLNGIPFDEAARRILQAYGKIDPGPKASEDTKKKRPISSFEKAIEIVLRQLNDKGGGRFVRDWSYQDEKGEQVFVVARFDLSNGKKQFRPLTIDAQGWYLGLGEWGRRSGAEQKTDKPCPLYRLPQVIQALEAGHGRLDIAEGEKCADALAGLGYVATTSQGGSARAWQTDWTTAAQFHEVVIWKDVDKPNPKTGKIPGDEYVADVCRLIHEAAREAGRRSPRIRIVDLQARGLSFNKDVYDLIDAMRQRAWNEEKIIGHLSDVLRDHGGDWSPPLEATVEKLYEQFDDDISGKRYVAEFPFPLLTRCSRALLPGTITILCAPPGASKSFMVLQCGLYWKKIEERFSILMLEETKVYHMHRWLAQISGVSDILEPAWCKDNASEVDAIRKRYAQRLGELSEHLCCMSGEINNRVVGDWLDSRVRDGERIIVIDPITVRDNSGSPWIDDQKFMRIAKEIVEPSPSRLILVTHPRKLGGKEKSAEDLLSNMAGGQAFNRFSQNVLAMAKHSPPKTVCVKRQGGAVDNTKINRRIVLAKTRNGPGDGATIGYQFDGATLMFAEQGLIQRGRR